MDKIEKELKAKYRSHLKEGDVIDFAARKKAKEPSVTDKLAGVLADFPNQIANQETGEAQARAWAKKLMTQGESSKKKWYIPFVMNHYQEGTHPIWAMVYDLEGYLDDMADVEHTKEQLRFLHDFITKHRHDMIKAIEADMAQGKKYMDKVRAMDIPLVDYALRPLQSAMYHAGGLNLLREKLIEFGRYGGIFNDPNSRFAHRSFVMLSKIKEDLETTQMERPFDQMRTDMPWYDEMLEKPDYFEEAKGVIWFRNWMSPDEYIQHCISGFSRAYNRHVSVQTLNRSEEKARKYADLMMSGVTFPMLVLDYTGTGFTQEGLHRAMAAKMAGIKKVPVLMVDNTAEERKRIHAREQERIRQRYDR
jgi:hypothetical protein